jgi:hypothetical protein
LTELAFRLQPLHGKKLPKIRVACAWPSTRAKSGGRLGECWHPEVSKDGVREIMITPLMDDPVEVAATVLHESLHAVLPPGVGHKAPFARLAKQVGLEGKPTSTYAGEKLTEKLKRITDDLGPYPHGAMDMSGRPKQTTRLLKVSCPECGYLIRMTNKWIEEAGYPICPQCNVEMGEEIEAENLLVHKEQSIVYGLKGTDRFELRLSKKGRGSQWFVIDFGERDDDPRSIGYWATAAARVVPAEGRQDAIDVATSIQEGLLTHEELEERVPEWLTNEEHEELHPEEDWRDLQYLADSEDEEHDHEDDLDEHEEELYNKNQKGRES